MKVRAQETLTVFAGPMHRATQLLSKRLEDLEARVRAGDEGAWPEYRETARTLVEVVRLLEDGQGGRLLTTKEMASRVGVSVKTLHRWRKAGRVKAGLERGKSIRWRSGDGLAGGR